MNFFCTKNHYDQWAAAGPNPDQYGLAIADAVAVSRALFGP
jgi:hypothetical protein